LLVFTIFADFIDKKTNFRSGPYVVWGGGSRQPPPPNGCGGGFFDVIITDRQLFFLILNKIIIYPFNS
jgi:hypothetical protein